LQEFAINSIPAAFIKLKGITSSQLVLSLIVAILENHANISFRWNFSKYVN